MKAKVPVCFIGTPGLKQVLRYRDPVSTRIGLKWEIQPATVLDLQSMFPQTFPPEAYAEIIAATRGNLRMIGNLWELLKDIKRAHDFAYITPVVVRNTAASFLLGAA